MRSAQRRRKMAAKPLDWKSWWDARSKITELWPGWSWSSSLGDQAMVNALQGGQVHYRAARAYDLVHSWESVPLRDVISTLQKLTIFTDEAIAEYETATVTTTTFGGGLVLTSQQHTRKTEKTARIVRPELVLSEFCDYLIQFELPAGVTLPTGSRRGGKARVPHPIWKDAGIEAMSWMNKNGRPVPGDRKQTLLETHILNWVGERDYYPAESTVRKHVVAWIEQYNPSNSLTN